MVITKEFRSYCRTKTDSLSLLVLSNLRKLLSTQRMYSFSEFFCIIRYISSWKNLLHKSNKIKIIFLITFLTFKMVNLKKKNTNELIIVNEIFFTIFL